MTIYLKRIKGDCPSCMFWYQSCDIYQNRFNCLSTLHLVLRTATHKEILQYRSRQAKKKLTDEKEEDKAWEYLSTLQRITD